MKSQFNFRVPYDIKRDEEEGCAAGCDFVVDGVPQESLTQQSFAKDADLNEIVRRCGVKDHELPFAPPVDPKFYGDVSDMPDLRTCLDRVKDATDRFMELPGALRARFQNMPHKWHEFVSNPMNVEECFKEGWLRRPEPVAEAPVPVAPNATSVGSSGG